MPSLRTAPSQLAAMLLPRCRRGFLSGAIRSPADLSEDDYRRVGQPRFAEEAFQKVGAQVAAAGQPSSGGGSCGRATP
jgi:hypothetical protein